MPSLDKWRGWVRECICTTSFSALVNGSPSWLFKASTGIRQCDPLSPFLFTLVVEMLSSILLQAKIWGFSMGCSRLFLISSLQMTLIFISTSWEEIAELKRALRCVQLVSVLKINICKSISVGVGCLEEFIRLLAGSCY
eukprot:TRINITY_DN19961_c1_g2_i1.p1 TRINITY_DN19961_c1_g2~~TRINITY_DN19961_c1_g2_i1.p1  ORF type:complete len:139 (-),score=16.46 TRINITY_DN19961_c1_g2_i1:242-658(-)